ncbi:DUF4192 domain-containing protein [Nocardiopsis halophila]|uniref:DUF4192 domain-containing protein n=1 Tax=Nocardiopsis halophila TaxID=141692 RepID=UPI0012684637|nr:DUF4192 domain-containing protein [Nocardiopsis halophila]
MSSDDRIPPSAATPDAAPVLSLRTPEDVLRAVPGLVGRRPDDSVVVLGLTGPSNRVRLALCAPADEPRDAFARTVADTLADEGCSAALAVGYGPPERITPRMDALREAVLRQGILLRDALRVTDGRYWSYLCPSVDCCPAEGAPFPDPAASAAPALRTPPGVPVPPALAEARETPSPGTALPGAAEAGPAPVAPASVAPVEGPERARMDRATTAAEARCARMWSTRDPGGHAAFASAFRAEGLREVRAAVAGALAGRAPEGADRVAWLALLLLSVRVRDEAWVRIRADDAALHADLWRRVFRMADPAYAAAPGSLLAFAAWLGGDAALAGAALDRVARLAPRYSMAALIRQALAHGVSPKRWRPVTPEWLERNAPAEPGPAAPPASGPPAPQRSVFRPSEGPRASAEPEGAGRPDGPPEAPEGDGPPH